MKLLYVKFVCVKLLYVKFVYVKLLYVKFVCVWSYSIVCDKGGGRRRRRREQEAPGIQNQKQEPHTKMWGTKTEKKWQNVLKTKTISGKILFGFRHMLDGLRAPSHTVQELKMKLYALVHDWARMNQTMNKRRTTDSIDQQTSWPRAAVDLSESKHQFAEGSKMRWLAETFISHGSINPLTRHWLSPEPAK